MRVYSAADSGVTFVPHTPQVKMFVHLYRLRMFLHSESRFFCQSAINTDQNPHIDLKYLSMPIIDQHWSALINIDLHWVVLPRFASDYQFRNLRPISSTSVGINDTFLSVLIGIGQWSRGPDDKTRYIQKVQRLFFFLKNRISPGSKIPVRFQKVQSFSKLTFPIWLVGHGQAGTGII